MDHIEEFDGTNHEDVRRLVFVVSLPVIMRGHAIQLKVSPELFFVRVPNLYNLALGLPVECSTDSVTAYFECTLRKLIVVVKVKREEDGEAAADSQEQKTVVVEVVDTKKLEGNDMLFDIV
jgi:hypothetical protein